MKYQLTITSLQLTHDSDYTRSKQMSYWKKYSIVPSKNCQNSNKRLFIFHVSTFVKEWSVILSQQWVWAGVRITIQGLVDKMWLRASKSSKSVQHHLGCLKGPVIPHLQPSHSTSSTQGLSDRKVVAMRKVVQSILYTSWVLKKKKKKSYVLCPNFMFGDNTAQR